MNEIRRGLFIITRTDFLKESFYASPSVTLVLSRLDYDYYGRIVAMYDGYGDAFGTNTVFNYYPITTPPKLGAGRLWQVVDPNGVDTLTYTYDALGRIQIEALTNTVNTRPYATS